MKKSLVVLLIAVLAVGFAFADFNFSGSFKAQHKFVFGDSTTVTASGPNKTGTAAEVDLSVSGDWFTISLNGNIDFNNIGADTEAGATIKLSDLLKTVDVDLPVSVNLLVGNNSIAGYHVYDTTIGRTSGGAYRNGLGGSKANMPIGAEVGYQGYKIEGAFNPVSKQFGVSVTGTIVDGVKFAADFAKASGAKPVAAASVAFDIAKLAKLEDWAIVVSADGVFSFADGATQTVYAEAVGKYKGLTVAAEFAMNPKAGGYGFGGDDVKRNQISAVAKYTFTELKKVTPTAYAAFAFDLTNTKSLLTVGVDASISKLTAGVSMKFINETSLTMYTKFSF